MNDMKIVRLDRRHWAHRIYGHPVGFRFNQFSCKSRRQIEHACANLFGWPGSNNCGWISYFGAKNASGFKTYWVTLATEIDLTAILLKAQYSD